MSDQLNPLHPITFYVRLIPKTIKEPNEVIYSLFRRSLDDRQSPIRILNSVEKYEDFAQICTVEYRSTKFTLLFGPVSPPDKEMRWVVATHIGKIPFFVKLFFPRKWKDIKETYLNLNNLLEKWIQNQPYVAHVERYIETKLDF